MSCSRTGSKAEVSALQALVLHLLHLSRHLKFQLLTDHSAERPCQNVPVETQGRQDQQCDQQGCCWGQHQATGPRWEGHPERPAVRGGARAELAQDVARVSGMPALGSGSEAAQHGEAVLPGLLLSLTGLQPHLCRAAHLLDSVPPAMQGRALHRVHFVQKSKAVAVGLKVTHLCRSGSRKRSVTKAANSTSWAMQ